MTRFLITLIFELFDFLSLTSQVLGCYKPSPLKKNLVPRFKRLGTKEIGKLSLEIIFSLPGGFLFSMVAPLDLQELDASRPGGSVGFLQNTNGYFTVGQILVEIH